MTTDARNVSRPARVLLATVALLLLAAPARAQAYDMLDYMFRDNEKKANDLVFSSGGNQPIRAYMVGPDRFYVTKGHPDATGMTREYEEWTFDDDYIYLVRDTTWQPEHWCSLAGTPVETSFELWTGGRNRGVRFPRYVTRSQVFQTQGAVIKARLEGNGCEICDAPSGDSDGLEVTSTYRFVWSPAFTFPTGKTVYDAIRVDVIAGVGEGESYYYAKELGWVGYEDDNGWAFYNGTANGGLDFEVVAKDACPGPSGCLWYSTRHPKVFHLTGEPERLVYWSANVPAHSPGFLAYGPYDSRWGVGQHGAYFYLSIDDNTSDNAVVATLDVVTDQGRRVLARRDLRRQEFAPPNSWKAFWLGFSYPSFEETEVRIFWHDRAFIRHVGTDICKVP